MKEIEEGATQKEEKKKTASSKRRYDEDDDDDDNDIVKKNEDEIKTEVIAVVVTPRDMKKPQEQYVGKIDYIYIPVGDYLPFAQNNALRSNYIMN
jgi:hypothetical protein